MDTWQKERLTSYLRNATRFLWGLGSGNQRENYRWLSRKSVENHWEQQKNFTYSGPYSRVEDDLLKNPGIERIVIELIIPQVKQYREAIDYLRVMWRKGDRPNEENIRNVPKFKSLSNDQFRSKFLPFVEMDYRPDNTKPGTYINYISGWGELAPIWFEEIEKMPGFADLWEKA